MAASAPAGTIHVPGDHATIQGAINAASDGQTILVAAGHYAEAIDLLGKSVVIRSEDGPQATTIDATGLGFRTVTIIGDTQEPAEVELRGFTITGGEAPGSAGNGGGMMIFGANTTIAECIITGNTAITGGGVYLSAGATVAIIDCQFTNNKAIYGGGLDVEPYNTITITGSTFTGNTANRSGGAMRLLESSAEISHSNFSDNVAWCELEVSETAGGGAIFALVSTLSVSDCTFTGNVADAAAAKGTTVFGGAIVSLSADATILDSTFDGNRVQHGPSGGGAIAHGGQWNVDKLTIKKCSFIDNAVLYDGSSGRGGALTVGALWEVRESTFVGNQAREAGAIQIWRSTGLLEASEFHANTAVIGGAVHLRDPYHVEIRACVFESNTGELNPNTPGIGWGGAVGVLSDGSLGLLSFSDCTFVDNTAFHGGAVRLWRFDRPHSYFHARFEHCEFIGNNAVVGGGLNVENIPAKVLYSVFEGNTAVQPKPGFHHHAGGGAIRASEGSLPHIQVRFSTFNGNTGYAGGAILALGTTIDHCTFTSNQSVTVGGALASRYSWISNSIIDQNTAAAEGGGIWSENSRIRHVTVSSNTAGTEGGGVYVHSDSFVSGGIGGTTFCHNSPDALTGDYDDAGNNLFLTECGTFNTLQVPAQFAAIQDAIDAAQTGDEIIVGPGTYHEAIDFLGKRISIRSSQGPEHTIIDATGYGTSAVMAEETGVGASISGFTITGGDAEIGGGIRLRYGVLDVDECIVTGNSAVFGGGVSARGHEDSYLLPGVIRITNSLIAANGADDGGGVVLIQPTGGSIDNTVIADNSAAERGGGVRLHLITQPFMIQHSTITGNSAGEEGGAVYSLYAAAHFGTCEFRENTAPVGGALAGVALHWPTIHGGQTSVANSLFCENKVGDMFGDIFDHGGNTFLNECPEPPKPHECAADLNGDGVVDVSDLLILLGVWGPCTRHGPGGCTGDFNGDGVVDVSDLLILLQQWGECP